MERNQNEKIAIKVSCNSIIVNIVLTILKLMAGVLSNSGAMISDAIHSASDVFSTFIVIIGVKLANKESDKEHPYGHERMECVAAIILAVILCATGIGIGYSGIIKIFMYNIKNIPVPGVFALVAAILSVVTKEAMYWYTRSAAKKINSGALMADAWHHRSDAMSSVGSFIGIIGARLGYTILDPVASVVICFFIIKAAFDIFVDSIGKMVDKSCDDQTIEKINDTILEQYGVTGIDQLKTRLFGDKIYVDIEIRAYDNLTLKESHDIAKRVHDAVENSFHQVKHCMVHVNPEENISKGFIAD